MLTPDYLAQCTDDIVTMYQSLEDEVIRDIARRILKTGFVTDTASWQLEKLQQAGVIYSDAIKQISRITGKSEEEIKKLFEDSATESLSYDDEVYKKVGLNPLPIKQSPAMLQLLTSSIKKCNGELKNLTLTTAVSAQTAYIQACDFAYMKVSSGVFDYKTAIRQAVIQAAGQGLNVIYPTGHISKLDVAIRRSTLTGVSQTCGKLQMQRMDDLDVDLVETTAHAGARIEHSYWQGRVFSRKGNGKYPDFVSSTGYGTGAGLMGWNCRHNFYPFFEGISQRAYTDSELNQLTDHRVEYNSKEYTDYEASQMQREFERNIRATKRELVGLDESIKATTDAELKNGFRADFAAKSVKLKRQEAKMCDFLEQTGRLNDSARTQKLGFGRSTSQKAVWANRREIDKYSKLRYNKNGAIVVTDDWTNKKSPTIPDKYKPNAVIDTKTKKGNTNRAIFDEESKLKKQINTSNHGNPKRHPFGKNGEHAHDVIWKDDKIVDRPARKLTDQERKENADIL